MRCAARACGADRIEVGFGLKSEFSPPVKKSACERLPFGNLSQSFMRSTIRSSAPERARKIAGTFNRSPAFTLFPGRPTRAAPLFLGLSSRICPIISRSIFTRTVPPPRRAPRPIAPRTQGTRATYEIELLADQPREGRNGILAFGENWGMLIDSNFLHFAFCAKNQQKSIENQRKTG